MKSFISFSKSSILDSIAIVLNDMYALGKSRGEIDLKRNSFYKELVRTNRKSLVAEKLWNECYEKLIYFYFMIHEETIKHLRAYPKIIPL